MARDDQPGGEHHRAEMMDLGMVSRDNTAGRRDVLEIGGEAAGRNRPNPRRLAKWLPAVLVAALVAVLLVQHDSPNSAHMQQQPTPQPTVPSQADAAPAGVATPQPVVTQYFDHPFLGLYSTWELYGLGPTNVVRIEFAKARLTRTEFPPLNSSGPVSFVVDGAGAVVRPLDHVAGYRIADSQPAHPLGNALGEDGPALPGPGGKSFWVPTTTGTHDVMILVDDAGNRLGPSIQIPYSMNSIPQPDGAGYLILADETGYYDARPSGLERITPGGLLAVGLHQWLVSECDKQHRCVRVTIDRVTGTRHIVDRKPPVPAPLTGAISPDGRFAALIDFDDRGRYNVHLLDLTTGRDRSLDVPMDDSAAGSALAWSPDSRWLFAAGEAGELFPIHPDTGQVELLHIPVPPLTQLVIRDGGS